MKRSIIMLAALLSVTGFIYSCKTSKAKSDLESLGLIAGESTANICHANITPEFEDRYNSFWEQKSIVANPGFKDRMRPVLASVPIELSSWFFLNGGKIQLIGNAKQFCPQQDGAPLYDANGEQSGCVVFGKEGEMFTMPTIFVNVGAREFKTQMEELSLIVQGFGAVFSSVLTQVTIADKFGSNNELLLELGSFDSDMKVLKSELVFAALEDSEKIKLEDGKTIIDRFPAAYRDLLKASKFFDKKTKVEQRKTLFMSTFQNEAQRDFVNYMMAQILDSNWCNDETRKQLYSETAPFKNTGIYFQQKVSPALAIALGSVSATTTATPVATPAPTTTGSQSAPSTANNLKLPILGAVIRAPFAVGEYFVENKPVRTYFANHKPVRKVLFGASKAVTKVAKGAANETGTALRTTAKVFDSGLTRAGYRIKNGCLIRRWRC